MNKVESDAESEAAFDETGVKRELTGYAARLVAGVALAFSTYQIVIAAFAPLSSLPTRSIHVGFLLALAFRIDPISARSNRRRLTLHDALPPLPAFALPPYPPLSAPRDPAHRLGSLGRGPPAGPSDPQSHLTVPGARPDCPERCRHSGRWEAGCRVRGYGLG